MDEILEILAEEANRTVQKGRLLKRIKESVDSINQNSNLDIEFSITNECLEINTKTLQVESDE